MNSLEDALRQFMLTNPELPEGEDTEPTGETTDKLPTDKLHVTIERKGRGGKTATIISGFTIDDDKVSELARNLKTKLGAGGSSRGGEILIQGERRLEVIKYLRTQGYRVN